MTGTAYVEFLQAHLPSRGLRWQGFRRVRGQVIKRLKRRLQVLHLQDLTAYSAYLETHPEEWTVFDHMCRISISRFYRDRGVFDALQQDVLPRLARLVRTRQEPVLRCWSAGCAAGEEVYTLQLMWQLGLAPRFPDVQLRIIATDVDSHMLERAHRGQYPWSSVKDLPPHWVAMGFDRCDESYVIRAAFRQAIEFVAHDIRQEPPAGPFHLILCRNLVFTYFAASLQWTILARMTTRLVCSGILLIGKHETLPPHSRHVGTYAGRQGFYQKVGTGTETSKP